MWTPELLTALSLSTMYRAQLCTLIPGFPWTHHAHPGLRSVIFLVTSLECLPLTPCLHMSPFQLQWRLCPESGCTATSRMPRAGPYPLFLLGNRVFAHVTPAQELGLQSPRSCTLLVLKSKLEALLTAPWRPCPRAPVLSSDSAVPTQRHGTS